MTTISNGHGSAAQADLHAGLQLRITSRSPVPLQAEFDCAPGELIALVGASGSGKTTLLRCIAGLHTSADIQGRISVGSDVWFDSAAQLARTPQARCVGLVFQHYALFPHLNAINNIAMCAQGMPGSGRIGLEISPQALSQKWLGRMGLADVALRPVQQLSGGQQQRVALARALVRIESSAHASGVLLLDEPFSAVDAPMRQVLYRELAQLRAQLQVPIVLVTHDLQEARRLASRIVIIDGGASLQSGSPAQVLSSPRNARVAHLVGIHNHFSARFHKLADGLAELHWGGSAEHPPVRLRVRDKGKIAHDTAVTWVLAGQSVQLRMRADHARHAARANASQMLGFAAGFSDNSFNNSSRASSDALSAAPSDASSAQVLACQLTELLPMGEISLCRFAVQGTSDSIELNLPASLLTQLKLKSGDAVDLAVPLDAAHIMPLRSGA